MFSILSVSLRSLTYCGVSISRKSRRLGGSKMLQTILMDKPFLATSGIRDDPELIMVMGVGF